MGADLLRACAGLRVGMGDQLMPDLILGVVEVAYTAETEPRDPTRARKTKKGRIHRQDAKRIQAWQEGKTDDGPATTVTVAQALEEKYHVMGEFVEHHKDELGGIMVNSLEGALEDLYASGHVAQDPLAEAGSEIAAAFRHYLMSAEIESYGLPGVPTKAAIERKSSRFKKGEGNARPSFIDTGAYELATRAWFEP